MPAFERPSKKPRDEPKGLDAFAAAASTVTLVPTPAPAPTPTSADTDTAGAGGFNVRFEADEKAALELLSRLEDRSMHKIVKRLLRPVLLAAAEEAARRQPKP